MVHKDIYTKFMIEYDKFNPNKEYPSLTEYEVATVLDKAYDALIAQKVTGNNFRRIGLEDDVKSISDIEPLIRHADMPFVPYDHTNILNVAKTNLPSDFGYFISLYIGYNIDQNTSELNPYDGRMKRIVPVKLITHQMAEKFFTSAYNIPWVKTPICYIENGSTYIVYDLLNPPIIKDGTTAHYMYVHKPNTFVKDLGKYDDSYDVSYFDCSNSAPDYIKNDYEFECDSTFAEELISLAITFALETNESPRLNAKLNTRGLES